MRNDRNTNDDRDGGWNIKIKGLEERLSPLIERVVHEIKKDYEEYRWVGTNQRKIKIYHKDIVCIQKIKGSKYAEYITENGKYMER